MLFEILQIRNILRYHLLHSLFPHVIQVEITGTLVLQSEPLLIIEQENVGTTDAFADAASGKRRLVTTHKWQWERPHIRFVAAIARHSTCALKTARISVDLYDFGGGNIAASEQSVHVGRVHEEALGNRHRRREGIIVGFEPRLEMVVETG